MIDIRMRRIEQSPSSDTTTKVLQLCAVLRRPLTDLEICELLSLRTSQTSRDNSRFVHGMSMVVANSGGLLHMNEEENTIHYVHASVQNHLFGAVKYRSRFSAAELDLDLGLLILIYLNFNNFKHGLVKATAKTNARFDPVQLATTPIFGHASTASRVAQRLLSKYTAFNQTQHSERTIREALGKETEVGYPFLHYASAFWIDHLESISSDSNPRLWGLFNKIMSDDDVIAEMPWNERRNATTSWSSRDTLIVMEWALQYQKPSLVMYLLVHHGDTLNAKQKLRIVETATQRTLYRFIDVLFKKHRPSRKLGAAAWAQAAKFGCLQSVDLCIELGLPTNVEEWKDPTPLQIAAKGGHIKVVSRLLDTGADVNAETMVHRTALQAAAKGGHLEVVKRLLEANADVNVAPEGRFGRTALQAAAGGGHLEVVNRLLDVNAATTIHWRGALLAAAEGGYPEVVKRLLEANADVNAVTEGRFGRTALHAAARGGCLEVVTRLLDANADVNDSAALYSGCTALQAAAQGGHLEVVNRLLEAKADVSGPWGGGLTALQAAVARGYVEVERRLLDAGAKH